MPETEPIQFEEIRTAYADAGPQREKSAFVDDIRCLSFLTSDWLTPEQARKAVQFIGGYNAFTPESAADIIAAIEKVDPDARFAIGREGSPVIYVETEDATAIMGVIDGEWDNGQDSPFHNGAPDELSEVEPGHVGSARKPVYQEEGGIEAHTMCQHSNPPVWVEDYAETTDENEYVRSWWD